MPPRNLTSEAGDEPSPTAALERAAAAQRAKAKAEDLKIEAKLASESHRFQAGIWSAVNLLLGIPATIFAALAAGFAAGESETGWTVGLAITSAVLTGLLTYLRPAERSAVHRKAYAAYDGLRYSADLVDVAMPEQSGEAYDKLVEEKKAVDKDAPHRPWVWDRKVRAHTSGTQR